MASSRDRTSLPGDFSGATHFTRVDTTLFPEKRRNYGQEDASGRCHFRGDHRGRNADHPAHFATETRACCGCLGPTSPASVTGDSPGAGEHRGTRRPGRNGSDPGTESRLLHSRRGGGAGQGRAAAGLRSAGLAGGHVRQGDGPVHPHFRDARRNPHVGEAEEIQEPGRIARGDAAPAPCGDHGRNALCPVFRGLHVRAAHRSLHVEGIGEHEPEHLRFFPDLPFTNRGALHPSQVLRVRQG